MGLPRLIYGTLGLEQLEPSRAERLVHAALDQGLTAFDTAPLYGLGAVEELLGRALREHRRRCTLLGKCGIVWEGEHGEVLFQSEAGGVRRSFRKNGLPASIRAEVHASLARLGVDCIDVMQVHQLDQRVPLGETLGALERLREEGKLRHIGVSNFPLPALRHAMAELARSTGREGGGLFSTQDEYSALERSRDSVLDAAREQGVQFLAYSPLANGLLAGRYGAGVALPSDHRRELPRFAPEAVAGLGRVLEGSGRELARRTGGTLGQLSLRWVLAQPGVSAAIVGGSSEAQIAENAAALEKDVGLAELAAFGAALERAGLVARGGARERWSGRARELWQRLRAPRGPAAR